MHVYLAWHVLLYPMRSEDLHVKGRKGKGTEPHGTERKGTTVSMSTLMSLYVRYLWNDRVYTPSKSGVHTFYRSSQAWCEVYVLAAVVSAISFRWSWLHLRSGVKARKRRILRDSCTRWGWSTTGSHKRRCMSIRITTSPQNRALSSGLLQHDAMHARVLLSISFSLLLLVIYFYCSLSSHIISIITYPY